MYHPCLKALTLPPDLRAVQLMGMCMCAAATACV